MALTGQRILGRDQETQQPKIRQRIQLEAPTTNYGITSPREPQQDDGGIMGQRMLRINNIASPPARGAEPIPQNQPE